MTWTEEIARYVLSTVAALLPIVNPLSAVGMVVGIIWMVSQALMPYAVGRAIDEGVANHQHDRLIEWGAILLGLGLTQALFGVIRHRFAVKFDRGYQVPIFHGAADWLDLLRGQLSAYRNRNAVIDQTVISDDDPQ